jgi:hypothetical protein
MAPITWMVMTRDISHAVRVEGEPVVVAALILDVDTGLVRGLSVAADLRLALAQAVDTALDKPAGSLPPGRPQRILAEVGMGDEVVAAVSPRPGLHVVPMVEEVVPGTEAEDIFDSFIEYLSTRRRSPGPPFPNTGRS